jgi:hypothetical protein
MQMRIKFVQQQQPQSSITLAKPASFEESSTITDATQSSESVCDTVLDKIHVYFPFSRTDKTHMTYVRVCVRRNR